MQNHQIYVNKISSAIAVFLNSRAQTQKTTSIEIDDCFKNYLIRSYGLNEGRYKRDPAFERTHRLRQYMRAHREFHVIHLTSLELKLCKQTITSIQKRTRVLRIKSPLKLSIRMTKFRVDRVNRANEGQNNHNDTLDSLLEYDRVRTRVQN